MKTNKLKMIIFNKPKLIRKWTIKDFEKGFFKSLKK